MMRSWTAVLACAVALAAQEPRVPRAANAPRQIEGHRPVARATPDEMWAHVRTAAQRSAAFRAGHAKPARVAPLPRPPGTSGPLAVVLVCADARLDVGDLLGVDVEDLVVVSVPGPVLVPQAFEAVADAVDAGASLLIVVTHEDCGAFAEGKVDGAPPSPPSELALHVARARLLATRLRRPLAPTFAQLQAEAAVRATERLRKRNDAGELEAVVCVVGKRDRKLHWIAPFAVRAPLVGTAAGRREVDRAEMRAAESERVPSPR